MGLDDERKGDAAGLGRLRDKRRKLERHEGDFEFDRESLDHVIDLVGPELTRDFAEVESVSGKRALSVEICELGLDILGSFTADRPRALASHTEFFARALSFELSDHVRILAADCLRLIAETDSALVTGVLSRAFEALDDPNWKVRQHSLSVISDSPSESLELPGVGSAIEARLDDDNWLVRAEAARAVSSLGEIDPERMENTRAPLIEALGDEEPAVRRQAGTALATIAGETPASTIERIDSLATSAATPRKRAGALHCANELCTLYHEQAGELTSTVVSCLLAEDEVVRSVAADVLETYARLLPDHRDQIIDRLIEALEDGDWTVSSAAARGLAVIAEGFPERAEEFIDPLLETLSHESTLARHYCGRSIARFVESAPELSDTVESELTERLLDGSLELRKSVAAVCYEMDPDDFHYAESVLDRLTQILREDTPDRRAGAAAGIAALAFANPQLLRVTDPVTVARPLDTATDSTDRECERYTRRMTATTILFAIDEEVFSAVPGIIDEARAELANIGPDASLEVRVFGTRAIGQEAVFVHCEHPQDVVEMLLQGLSDPHKEVRRRAAAGLVTASEHFPDLVAPHLSALEHAIFDSGMACQSAAVDAVSNIGASIPRLRRRCLRSLEHACRNSSWQVHSEAIAGFQQIGERDVNTVTPYLPVLVEGLHHQDELIGERAADTLSDIVSADTGRIGRALEPELEKLLDHPRVTPYGRTIGIELLSRIPSTTERATGHTST